MSPNVEELQLGLKLVELGARVRSESGLRSKAEHPAWLQGDWVLATKLEEGFCLTAGCFAGHVMMHAGFTEPLMDQSPPFQANSGQSLETIRARGYDGHVFAIKNPLTGEVAVMDEDEPDSIARLAGERLGLDEDQQRALFDGDNSLEDIRAIVADLCQQ